MDTWIWIVVAAIAVIVIGGALAIWWMSLRRGRRSERLQSQFGNEYERTVRSEGRKQGENDLVERQERVESLSLRPLSGSEAERFAQLWTATQGRFVDEPGAAVADADRLVTDVMQARGYPMGDFEQRAADVSVDHPQVVSNYRAAHAAAAKHARGEATTEDLRQAMVHYRVLFTDLLETDRQPQATYREGPTGRPLPG